MRTLLNLIGWQPQPDRPYLWLIGRRHVSVLYHRPSPLRWGLHIGRRRFRVTVVKITAPSLMVIWDRDRAQIWGA